MSQNKPWLTNYDPGIPHTLRPYPQRTLYDVLEESARQRPEHPAMIFQGSRISYRRLSRESDAFAAALVDLGLAPGDRVALMLPNSPQMIIALVGAWKAGAIVSPLNPLYTGHELIHALNATGARIAVVLSPFYEKVKGFQRQTALREIIVTNIKEYLPWRKRVLFSLFREKPEGHRVTVGPRDHSLSHLLHLKQGASRPRASVDPNDAALLMFTGGTTGKPKAALSSHRALLMASMQIVAWLGDLNQPWRDVHLLLMPMFHTYGCIGAFGTAVVGRHTMAIVPNPRDLDAVIETIQATGPAYVAGVPTLFVALLAHPTVRANKVDFTSIKLCISGAAPLLAETKRRFEQLTGGRLIEGYALTESVMGAVLTPVKGHDREGAIGMPLPDVEIRIVDPKDSTQARKAGQPGEILLRAPQLMLGYWGQPTETAAVIRDGWLHTGDIGYLDEDGYLTLVDRAKALIKPSGFQVWPREVEEVIATHPDVVEVGVAGVPDARRGEAVKAWVVLKSNAQLTAAELRAYCREYLAAYKVPRRVAFVDELPKSSVGKVLRRQLTAMETKRENQPRVEA
ncbi:MAG: long-chain fatty acid--CoA ligase [Candidatus Promineifilaceae bacterium]|nr:long-chain fatty acid--CoA ligase [Candidatus Promineifilaceae bacterium]